MKGINETLKHISFYGKSSNIFCTLNVFKMGNLKYLEIGKMFHYD